MIPISLAVGKYEATLIIDAGPAGFARYPVTLDVRARPVPAPAISSIGSAATLAGPIARGGLVTIKGTNFGGSNVAVAFDGKPARILYSSADQINVQAPADLAGPDDSRDGHGWRRDERRLYGGRRRGGSWHFRRRRFEPGQQAEHPESPALSPSIIQIFATGLLPAQGTARIEVQLQDALYSGADLALCRRGSGDSWRAAGQLYDSGRILNDNDGSESVCDGRQWRSGVQSRVSA